MQELIRLAQIRDKTELRLCSIIAVIRSYISTDEDGENIRDYWKHLGSAD